MLFQLRDLTQDLWGNSLYLSAFLNISYHANTGDFAPKSHLLHDPPQEGTVASFQHPQDAALLPSSTDHSGTTHSYQSKPHYVVTSMPVHGNCGHHES